MAFKNLKRVSSVGDLKLYYVQLIPAPCLQGTSSELGFPQIEKVGKHNEDELKQ